jgi:small-conductance mechanosensitive channel
MMTSAQMCGALKSIQSLIIQARHQAYSAGAQQVGDLLDDMELLPEILSDEQDRRQEFRDALEDIAQKHPECRYIVDQFLARAVSA